MSGGVVNYTTKVEVTVTLAEMQARLASAGANHIGVGYEDGAPCALTFMLQGPHGPRHFTVPVDVESIQRLIRSHVDDGRIKSGGGLSKAALLSREHASRVAWRVMKDWLAATLAIVEAGLLPLDEVMLPYINVAPGKTLAQAYRESEGALAIEGNE